MNSLIKRYIEMIVIVAVGFSLGCRGIMAAIPEQERAALIAFYNANNGDNWQHKKNWKGNNNEPDGFSQIGSEGTWFGISVESETVTQISLTNEPLITQIPPEFASLTNLRYLNLAENGINSPFPSVISSLSSLNSVRLSGNHFIGGLPKELTGLPNLEELNLQACSFIGSIPPEYGNFPKLKYLYLNGNDLFGSIPVELGNISTLEELSLSNNRLIGGIPPQLGNLTRLKSLYLSADSLSGTIPPGIGKYATQIDLSENSLSGEIPQEVLYSVNGRWYLNLSGNHLTGSIPPAPEIGVLPYISLYLSNNELSGEIPISFFLHSDFIGESRMDLSYNNLSGNIPKEIDHFLYLSRLDLSHNNFSGSIPKEIGKTLFLEEIDLSMNKFSGSIPAELFNCPWLSMIDLSSNLLSGEFPSGIIDKFIYKLNIGYNLLYSTNSAVISKLNTYDPDWAETQTVLPSNIKAIPISSDSIRISWDPILYTTDEGGYQVYYSALGGETYVIAGKTADKSASYFDVTGLKPGTIYNFMVRTLTYSHQLNKSDLVTSFSNSISATTIYIPPFLSINRTQFYFCEFSGKSSLASQYFTVSNNGGGDMPWSATSNQSWLNVTPDYGLNWGKVTISVDTNGLSKAIYNGEILIYAFASENSPQIVQVQLIVKPSTEDQPPFGYFETPIQGSIVSGSIPVTGWALDDSGIAGVNIYREPVSGEAEGLVYIGDACFVEGARPDVEVAYPNYPENYKAGWGYMLLTNFLPNHGNGTFTFHAIAFDTSGNRTTLGTKTVTCDNAHAVKPFGAIDTPIQGGVASGRNFVNFGWALTPYPNQIPINGSTMDVWIDGKIVGRPGYNEYREDIAELFPGYNNSNGAGGYFYFDTRAYENGVHTIAWTVTDNAGNTDGIGSRYFRVENMPSVYYGKSGESKELSKFFQLSGLLRITEEEYFSNPNPVYFKKGFSEDSTVLGIKPNENGIFSIEIHELEPVEIYFGSNEEKQVLPKPDRNYETNNQYETEQRKRQHQTQTKITGTSFNSKLKTQNSKLESAPSNFITGYMVVGNELRALLIGSTLDKDRGIFFWQPGPGFVGNYRFRFVEIAQKGHSILKEIMIKVVPKF